MTRRRPIDRRAPAAAVSFMTRDRPMMIAFSVNDEDLIYVFDSESDNVYSPGFEQGIRIGDALNGWVKYFILDQGGNPNAETGMGPEFGVKVR
jgi:hypothetical protein